MIPNNFTPEILRFDTLDSTNLKAREIAKNGGAEGTVIVAENQTSGRGQGKKTWHSPTGGLYLSVLLYAKDAKRPTDISLLAGAALAQAVKECLPKNVDVTVKWPNDCLVGWKKIGGILCETMGEEYFNMCIVGIGLNTNVPDSELEPFKANTFSATSFMSEVSGGTFDNQKVLNTLLMKLFTLYRLYQEQGFAPIQYIWQKNCRFIGKKVELRETGWKEADKHRSGVGSTVGNFVGIDESGAIVLSDPKGVNHHYYSGEITCFWP